MELAGTRKFSNINLKIFVLGTMIAPSVKKHITTYFNTFSYKSGESHCPGRVSNSATDAILNNSARSIVTSVA